MKKTIAAAATGLLVLSMTPLAAMAAVPGITGIFPSSVTMGSAALTLTVNGSDFDGTSVVYFNGSPRGTNLVSSGQLTASIPVSDLSTAGAFNVMVTNSGTGGGTSNSATFTVTGSSVNPVPMLFSINPASRIAGSGSFTMTLNGANFIPGSVVRYNGLMRSTTFISSNQLTTAIPASDIATAELYAVDVVNPTPGGGASNARIFIATALAGETPKLPNTGFGPDDSALPFSAGLVLAALAGAAIIGLFAWKMRAAMK